MGSFKSEEAKHRRLIGHDKQLADRIRWFRRNNNLTQEQLSEKLGMHVDYISRIERYDNGVSLPVLHKLARIFGIKVRDLFDF
jgi:XRE family transcriptional regulator, regulator of sulfur utilization